MTEAGALSAAGWAWLTHATVGSGCGWLGVVNARQADLSGRLGATGRCASTGGVLVMIIITVRLLFTQNLLLHSHFITL